jgi:hypothetical protein
MGFDPNKIDHQVIARAVKDLGGSKAGLPHRYPQGRTSGELRVKTLGPGHGELLCATEWWAAVKIDDNYTYITAPFYDGRPPASVCTPVILPPSSTLIHLTDTAMMIRSGAFLEARLFYEKTHVYSMLLREDDRCHVPVTEIDTGSVIAFGSTRFGIYLWATTRHSPDIHYFDIDTECETPVHHKLTFDEFRDMRVTCHIVHNMVSSFYGVSRDGVVMAAIMLDHKKDRKGVKNSAEYYNVKVLVGMSEGSRKDGLCVVENVKRPRMHEPQCSDALHGTTNACRLDAPDGQCADGAAPIPARAEASGGTGTSELYIKGAWRDDYSQARFVCLFSDGTLMSFSLSTCGWTTVDKIVHGVEDVYQFYAGAVLVKQRTRTGSAHDQAQLCCAGARGENPADPASPYAIVNMRGFADIYTISIANAAIASPRGGIASEELVDYLTSEICKEAMTRGLCAMVPLDGVERSFGSLSDEFEAVRREVEESKRTKDNCVSVLRSSAEQLSQLRRDLGDTQAALASCKETFDQIKVDVIHSAEVLQNSHAFAGIVDAESVWGAFRENVDRAFSADRFLEHLRRDLTASPTKPFSHLAVQKSTADTIAIDDMLLAPGSVAVHLITSSATLPSWAGERALAGRIMAIQDTRLREIRHIANGLSNDLHRARDHAAKTAERTGLRAMELEKTNKALRDGSKAKVRECKTLAKENADLKALLDRERQEMEELRLLCSSLSEENRRVGDAIERVSSAVEAERDLRLAAQADAERDKVGSAAESRVMMSRLTAECSERVGLLEEENATLRATVASLAEDAELKKTSLQLHIATLEAELERAGVSIGDADAARRAAVSSADARETEVKELQVRLDESKSTVARLEEAALGRANLLDKLAALSSDKAHERLRTPDGAQAEKIVEKKVVPSPVCTNPDHLQLVAANRMLHDHGVAQGLELAQAKKMLEKATAAAAMEKARAETATPVYPGPPSYMARPFSSYEDTILIQQLRAENAALRVEKAGIMTMYYAAVGHSPHVPWVPT